LSSSLSFSISNRIFDRMNNKPLYTIFNKSYNLRIGYFVIALTFFMNKKKSSLNKFLQCCSHFFIQAKHGIIVKIFILLISGQKWAVKFNKQGLNPWYERNLENIMMNMQDLFHDFLNILIVENVDLKPF